MTVHCSFGHWIATKPLLSSLLTLRERFLTEVYATLLRRDLGIKPLGHQLVDARQVALLDGEIGRLLDVFAIRLTIHDGHKS